MPSYDYFCETHGTFEEFHSIMIKLEFCPKCKEGGLEQPVERLISAGSKGIVELYGEELVESCKAEGKKIQQEAATDAKRYANLIGEGRYHQIQTQLDRRSK